MRSKRNMMWACLMFYSKKNCKQRVICIFVLAQTKKKQFSAHDQVTIPFHFN